CGSRWNTRQTSPFESFKPIAFGLHDMSGNVWQLVQDCYHDDYNGAPTDGSAWISVDCRRRVGRGGSRLDVPQDQRSASRVGYATDVRFGRVGFRVGRTLTP